MGNHQFGFANRPTPDFLGKGWTYVKEKRRSTKEKKTKPTTTSSSGAETILRRPSSTTSFLKVRYSEVLSDGVDNLDINDGPLGTCSSTPGTGTPKSMKRNSSVKRTRSMRCSPTVPDSLTFTLGMVNNVVLGAAGVAAAAAGGANVDQDAVANALDALQKLTPAAPQLFKQPSFDEFFEEAERRNQTMEVLQAALIKPSSSSASIGAQTSSTSESKETPTSKDVIVLVEDQPLESRNTRTSPITVQPPTPPVSCRRSPVSRSRDYNHIISDDEEDSLLAKDNDTYSTTKSARVLIIVGGCSDVESLDGGDRWDRSPPTLIVQPSERLGESLFPPAPSSSSSSLTTASTSTGGTPRVERRRGSYNFFLTSNIQTPSGVVRFADEVESKSKSKSQLESIQLRDGTNGTRRIKRRSSLRRKTIGGITSLSCDSEETAAGVMANANAKTADDVLQKSRPLTKKSHSRSDLVQPPSIISLLTPPQINLIRNLWTQLYATKGPTVLGNHIFQRVVFKNPQVREVFRRADVGNQYFNVDLMCKSHAKAVAGVLDDVVRNLDNLISVETKLTDLGRQHAVFADLGFHLNFWSVFAEAFIDCTLEWGEKNRRVEEARKAWAIIMAYITDKMKFGYQEARRSNLPRCSSGRRIRVSETETSATNTNASNLGLPLIRSDSH